MRRLNDMLRNRFVSIILKCDNIDTIDIDIQNKNLNVHVLLIMKA